MSRPTRIGLVCEGATDQIVIGALIGKWLGSDDFTLVSLQPLRSAIAGDSGPFGGGWKGVRSWCAFQGRRGPSLVGSSVLLDHDVVIIHMDADVSRDVELKQLALNKPCPPASATCDAIRSHIHKLLGGGSLPAQVVFCVPADSTEAWVIAALAPDVAAKRKHWECYRKPESLLKQVPRPDGPLGKNRSDYARVAPSVAQQWHNAKRHCPEAARFESELRRVLPASD